MDEATVHDVLKLSDYSEGSLVRTLSARFKAQQCYTYAGSILLSLNPHDWLYGLYTDEVRALRSHHMSLDLPLSSVSITDLYSFRPG